MLSRGALALFSPAPWTQTDMLVWVSPLSQIEAFFLFTGEAQWSQGRAVQMLTCGGFSSEKACRLISQSLGGYAPSMRTELPASGLMPDS